MIASHPPSLVLFFAVLFVAQAILFPLLTSDTSALTISLGMR